MENVNPQAPTADSNLDTNADVDAQDRHTVPSDESGHVLARSSGDQETPNEVTVHNVDEDRAKLDLSNKDTTQLPPAPSPLDPQSNPAPQRHQHTAHDVEGRDLTADDADFDADERPEEDNADGSS